MQTEIANAANGVNVRLIGRSHIVHSNRARQCDGRNEITKYPRFLEYDANAGKTDHTKMRS